jgi:hypothetical protein
MASSVENAMLEEHIASFDVDREVATSREIIYLTDINNTSYAGQIVFDLSPWSNNQKMIDYANSYIQIPYVIRVNSSVALGADVNPFCVGLKNGYFQLIDSIQVSLNGQNVVEQQSFTNFHACFKALTSFSADDQAKWGSTLGFYKDNVGGITFSQTKTIDGDGFINNKDAGEDFKVDYTKGNHISNEGFKKRKEISTAYDPLKQLDKFTTLTNESTGMNVWKKDTNDMYWLLIATIRLKDISDFFEKAGLLRNVSIRMTINYNTCTTAIQTEGTGSTMKTNTITQQYGNSNPVMVSGTSTGCANGAAGSMKTDAVYTITTAIGSLNGKNPHFTSCRWYASSYTLTPRVESLIRDKYSIKDIRYNDIYTYKITNKFGNFNQIISNGIVNPKYILVLPFADPTATNLYDTTTVKAEQYQSVFDTAPATTCPLSNISNFQVQLGGKNMFQTSLEYSWENFLFELSAINAKNGGALTGDLSSGLIDRHDFEFGYRYYVCDLSRRSEVEQGIPQSITILGNNTTQKAMNYIVIVAYEKSVKVSMIDGQIKK